MRLTATISCSIGAAMLAIHPALANSTDAATTPAADRAAADAVPPAGAASGAASPAGSLAGALPPAPSAGAANCLPSGDGYLRARLAGAIDARIDWPNSGTRCQGESKSQPPGIRLSFQRASGQPNLLFVFGITGIREGRPAHDTGVNLTVFVQGTDRVFGTLGDSRCTVDSLSQKSPRFLHATRARRAGRRRCAGEHVRVRRDGDVRSAGRAGRGHALS
jgi:hypothetical protein